jgi:hypothetical protein
LEAIEAVPFWACKLILDVIIIIFIANLKLFSSYGTT